MDVSEEAAASRPPEFQAPSTVRVMPRFVNRLCARLETVEPASSSISGLLFGAVQGDQVVVHAFRSLTTLEMAAVQAGGATLEHALKQVIAATERDPAFAGIELAGWYGLRPEAGLQQADIEFYERRFGSKPGIALIIRSVDPGFLLFDFYAANEAGKLTCSEYRCGTEQFSRKEAISDPIDIALHAHLERAAGVGADGGVTASVSERRPNARVPVLERRGHSASEEAEPKESTPPERKPRRHAWRYPAILFGLAAAGTFAALLWPGVNIPGMSFIFGPARADTALHLRAEGQGDRILLTWNRHNPIARTAAGANLHIDDGSQHRQIHFDGSQLAIGSVLYRPMSDDVSFRLEIQGQNGQSESEGIRVLDSSRRPAEPVDVAVTNTAPSDSPPSNSAPTTPEPVKQAAAAKRTLQQHTWHAAPSSLPPSASKTPAPVIEELAENRPSLTGSATPSLQKFDLSRLTEATIPASNGQIPEIPAEPKSEPAVIKPARAPERTSPDQPIAERTGPAQPPATATGTARYSGRYVAPRPTRQVLPDVSLLPQMLVTSAGEVNVIVTIDKTGHVTSARAEPGKNVPRALVAAAEHAAQQWVFEPARLDGQPVLSEHSIIFQFSHR